MQKPFFSVIIPVYNVGDFVAECLDSVLDQTFTSYEIILVDDGSTDRSGTICNSYAAEDSRISVYHKHNEGLGLTRNYGVAKAIGRYLVFLDSDDWWVNNALEDAYEAIEFHNYPDVLGGGYKAILGGQVIREDILLPASGGRPISGADALKKMLQENKVNYSACLYFIKQELFTGGSLLFGDHARCEDIAWLPQLYCSAKSFAFTENKFYRYRLKRNGSLSNTIFTAHQELATREGVLQAIERTSALFDDECRDTIGAYGGFVLVIYMNCIIGYPITKQRLLYTQLRQHLYLLDHQNYRKLRVVRSCIRFFGIELTSILLHIRAKFLALQSHFRYKV